MARRRSGRRSWAALQRSKPTCSYRSPAYKQGLTIHRRTRSVSHCMRCCCCERRARGCSMRLRFLHGAAALGTQMGRLATCLSGYPAAQTSTRAHAHAYTRTRLCICAKSLFRICMVFGTVFSYADCFMLHRDDPEVDVSHIVDAVSTFVHEGLARTWGVSNWSLERLQAAHACVDTRTRVLSLFAPVSSLCCVFTRTRNTRAHTGRCSHCRMCCHRPRALYRVCKCPLPFLCRNSCPYPCVWRRGPGMPHTHMLKYYQRHTAPRAPPTPHTPRAPQVCEELGQNPPVRRQPAEQPGVPHAGSMAQHNVHGRRARRVVPQEQHRRARLGVPSQRVLGGEVGFPRRDRQEGVHVPREAPQ